MVGDISVKGGTTKSKIFTGPESHKLHLEFDLSPASNAALIHRGQPVKLSTVTVDNVAYEVVVPANSFEPEMNIIGVSIHEQDSAYKGSIVVATRGYVVVLAQAHTAIDMGDPVAVGNGTSVYDNTTGYTIVSPLVTAATPVTTDDAYQFGWALEAGAHGDIIKVLVKN
jgi:hypothetical protein